MNNKSIINSVNLYSDTNFPYLVLHITDENSYPRNPGFQTVHWHEDLQFIYVLDGNVTVKTLTDSVLLKKGDGAFINKNVVHFATTNDCDYYSFVFPDCFLKFYFGSPCENSVNRIVGQNALPVYRFSQTVTWHQEVLHKLRQLFDLEHHKDEWYSYRVLCELSSMWLIIQSNLALPRSEREHTTNVRMKLFLEYIHGHFAERISLGDLAQSANVSISEVLRCFKNLMQITPYKYITELRLQKAATLLKETNEPVTSIIDDVGFSSLSHFGKCFKKKTGYSPKEYREAHTAADTAVNAVGFAY